MEKTAAKLELITRYFPGLSNAQVRQFAALDGLYREWNSKINVISREDIGDLYEKHVLHSLSIAAAYPVIGHATVIDIGTGGGFPGIPLAIYFPGAHFHLIDGTAKKISVVRAVAQAIGLANLTADQVRAEEFSGRRFNLVVSRAVAPLKELWQWSRPLLKKPAKKSHHPSIDGLICLKGGDLKREIDESGCTPEKVEITTLFPLPFFQQKYILHIPPS